MMRHMSKLHHAVRFHDVPRVKAILVTDGARLINTFDLNGLTPLMTAALFEHVDMVKLLCDHGAKLRLKNKKGYSAALDGSLKASRKRMFWVTLAVPQSDCGTLAKSFARMIWEKMVGQRRAKSTCGTYTVGDSVQK